MQIETIDRIKNRVL